jgi:hypothetical protein
MFASLSQVANGRFVAVTTEPLVPGIGRSLPIGSSHAVVRL